MAAPDLKTALLAATVAATTLGSTAMAQDVTFAIHPDDMSRTMESTLRVSEQNGCNITRVETEFPGYFELHATGTEQRNYVIFDPAKAEETLSAMCSGVITTSELKLDGLG